MIRTVYVAKCRRQEILGKLQYLDTCDKIFIA